MKIKKLVETFDNKKTSKRNTLSEMTIGYDEDTIKRMISQLEKEIEDYEQLIVDEPEDADYWKEMIARCQDEITELKSYKPL
jgi:DNA repair exonuclease SbcCD ATPase subunit